MKFSIRNFLLLNLFLTLILSTLLIGIGNYYIDQKDIHEHLDDLMVQSGLSYSALVSTQRTPEEWQALQRELAAIPRKVQNYYSEISQRLPVEKIYFQIIDKHNHILLRSPVDAPILPIPRKNGLSDMMTGGVKWRVFSSDIKASGTRVLLAERYESRGNLGKLIAVDDLYILLFVFPISAILVWIIVGKGLKSLAKVAKEVADREPMNLSPVKVTAVPEEIKPLVNELNFLFERLEAGFGREKRFATDAAHELRTPLAALKAQAQVAISAPTLQEKNQALEKLVVTLQRSVRIVQQLLTMSQLGPDSKDTRQLSKVNLVQVTQEVLAMLIPLADQYQLEISFDYMDASSFIQGNATALSILIRNLVENAIRYTYEKSTVQLRVYKEFNRVVLEVEDAGPGIPPALRERVFERFYRVVGSQPPGSGLGLAIVRQVCELHHAKIQLDSPKSGTGLIVRVIFKSY